MQSNHQDTNYRATPKKTNKIGDIWKRRVKTGFDRLIRLFNQATGTTGWNLRILFSRILLRYVSALKASHV